MQLFLKLTRDALMGAVIAVLAVCIFSIHCVASGTLKLWDQAQAAGWVPALGLGDVTDLANLWVPPVWANARREAKIKAVGFFSSGVVITDPEIVAVASGPGSSVDIPFLIEADPTDQVQKEGVAPTINNITSGIQRAAVLQRVSPLGGTALAKAMSGADPIVEILATLDLIRARQRATALQSQLSGLFGLAAAANHASGAFRGLRLDNFVEVVGDQTAAHLIDSEMVIDAIALMGEAKARLEGGVFLCHSKIEAALNKQDAITTVYDSQGKFVMKIYKGMMVVMDDRLVRPGTTSGFVYFSFICARGAVATGDKPQIFTDKAGEVAAVQADYHNLSLNQQVIYDRTRYILHPQGAKWVGTAEDAATGGTATNAQLATVGNWELAFADVRNIGLVCLRTNG